MGTDTFDHDNYCYGCGQKRNAKYHYLERAKRNETNLAELRAKLGVTGKPNWMTLQRIEDILDLARAWVLYTDSLS